MGVIIDRLPVAVTLTLPSCRVGFTICQINTFYSASGPKSNYGAAFWKTFHQKKKKKRNESLDFLCVAIKWEDNSTWVHHTGLRFSIMDISGVTDKVQGDGAQQPTTWQELREQIWVHQPKAGLHGYTLHPPPPPDSPGPDAGRALMVCCCWLCTCICASARASLSHRDRSDITGRVPFPPIKKVAV